MRRCANTVLSMLLGAIALGCAWPVVQAGPLADALKARREQRAPTADPSELDGDGDAAVNGQASPSLPTDVETRRELAFGPDPAQKLDVYIPHGAKSAPILVMVHGGAWMFGDKQAGKVVNAKVAHWAPRGYIVVSPNYRKSLSPKVLDQAQDIARALAFTQANAASWGGDPARVVLMGHSAGAHLVALLSADIGIATAQGAKPWVATVALDSAALDVVGIMDGKHAGFYDRVFGADRSFWAEVSPMHRLTGAPAAPMLLVCSSQRADSCPRAKAFAAKATAAGGRASVLPVDLSHGNVNGELGLDNGYTRSVDEFLQSLRLP